MAEYPFSNILHVGIWCSIMLLLIVIFKLSRYLKLITVFTEECFAGLISLIFIIDGLKKIATSNSAYGPACADFPVQTVNTTCLSPLNLAGVNSTGSCYDMLKKTDEFCAPSVPSVNGFSYCDSYQTCADQTGYFSIMLSILTLIFCFAFQAFKKTNWLPSWIRNLICNFGVVLSIAACFGIDYRVVFETLDLGGGGC